MMPAQASPSIVRFGEFEADLRGGDLYRNGVKVHLQDLPFRTLVVLVSHPDEVVTHEELRQALWPGDTFVDFERAIRSAIKRLRDALRDNPHNPIFIETVERRGYRWIGPIRSTGPLLQEPRETVSQELPLASRSSPWRKLVFALPVLALLFAAWIFRPAYRDARVGASVKPAPDANLHKAANPEAEDLYLKGRFYWNKRTPESLNLAVDAFTQAIVHDPKYAPAYMGLADCYNLLREYSAMPPQEAYARAFSAAKKAVELDQQSSEAHASLAFVTFYGMWDVNGAEQEFRRAIALDPNDAKAHHWYATFLQTIGRHRESLEEIERARELDPHSSSILADRGRLLWAAGHREEGLQLLKQIEMAEQDFVSPHRYLRYAYLETGDYVNYLLELKKEALLTHDVTALAVAEGAAKGFVERRVPGLLETQLREQKNFYERGNLSAYWLAQTENLLGDKQKALEYLEICAQAHDDTLMLLGEDPVFKNLHDNPSFQQILAKLGMESPE
jgi:DNA-binding winged helix-turn-helix (wHTH) protein/Tfp pilus assembly protein PilF